MKRKQQQIPLEDILFFPDYVKIDEMLRYGCKFKPRFWRSGWVWTYKKHTQTQNRK